MNRRGFLQLLGAGAAITAAGLIVPDVARKFFLPPTGGWRPDPIWGGQLTVGDTLTFGGVYEDGNARPLRIRKLKQFIVTSIEADDALIVRPRYRGLGPFSPGDRGG
jgi:hypothetical protein